jgi:hypothetical protein
MALKNADMITGRISNKMALTDTANNKIKATVRYPIKSTNKKQSIDVAVTMEILSKNGRK